MLTSDIHRRANSAKARIGSFRWKDIVRCAEEQLRKTVYGNIDPELYTAVMLLGYENEFCKSFPQTYAKKQAFADICCIWKAKIPSSSGIESRGWENFDVIRYLSLFGNFGHLWDMGVSAGIPACIESYFSGIPIDDIVA